MFSGILIILWGLLTLALILGLTRFKPSVLMVPVHQLFLTFAAGFIFALAVFCSFTPSNNHQWLPENAQLLDYTLASDGKTLTLYNVSNIAGFFRKYEPIILAADEKEVIYRHSNVNHEAVYIYPIHYDEALIRALLMAYLNQAKHLTTQPKWYNLLLDNCTTAVYQLVNPITLAPLDYRIIASGYIPEYLYDNNAIDHKYSYVDWKKRAAIVPKTKNYNHQHPISSSDYSKLIRQDF